jgi:hypothetical protein
MKEFNELFAKLPHDVQKQAIDAYRIFKVNPYHPGFILSALTRKNPGILYE